MILDLCADKKCKKKNSCFRYVIDPNSELRTSHKIRVSPTLKHPDEEVCSKYCGIVLKELS